MCVVCDNLGVFNLFCVCETCVCTVHGVYVVYLRLCVIFGWSNLLTTVSLTTLKYKLTIFILLSQLVYSRYAYERGGRSDWQVSLHVGNSAESYWQLFKLLLTADRQTCGRLEARTYWHLAWRHARHDAAWLRLLKGLLVAAAGRLTSPIPSAIVH